MSLFSFSHKKQGALKSAEEFSRFYEQAHRSVYRYVMVLCGGNQGEAEELTAGAFFRAWEKRGQFSGSPGAALGWVITIARNLLIDQRRSEGGRPPEILLDEGLGEAGDGIEAILVEDEQLQQVLEAVQALPFPQRDLFTLRHVLGWRVKDIAAHLGLAENTVSVDLRRALAKLQSQLSPPGGQGAGARRIP